mgnify:FL=1
MAPIVHTSSMIAAAELPTLAHSVQCPSIVYVWLQSVKLGAGQLTVRPGSAQVFKHENVLSGIRAEMSDDGLTVGSVGAVVLVSVNAVLMSPSLELAVSNFPPSAELMELAALAASPARA